MRFIATLTVLAILTLVFGSAAAGESAERASLIVLDVEPAGGWKMYVDEGLGLWADTNDADGLQNAPVPLSDGSVYHADTLLL